MLRFVSVGGRQNLAHIFSCVIFLLLHADNYSRAGTKGTTGAVRFNLDLEFDDACASFKVRVAETTS